MENKEKDTSLPRLHLTVDAVDLNERIKTRLIERYRIFRKTIGNAIAERREGSDADYSGWLVLTVIDGSCFSFCLETMKLTARNSSKNSLSNFTVEILRHSMV